MKLWLLKAKKSHTGYINNQNIVVRASTEKDARGIASLDDKNAEWYSPLYASCEELLPEGIEGVVIVDNNGS